MNASLKILQGLRNFYTQKIINYDPGWAIQSGFNLTGQEASDVIKKRLREDDPLMICRFGWNEIGIISTYLSMQKGPVKYIEYIQGSIDIFWWDKNLFSNAFSCIGLFPLERKTLEQFGELMLEDINQVDVLGSWLKKEEFFKNKLIKKIKIPLIDLDPYHHANPWSEALAGKKILVVHPFAESIQKQYQKRLFLFKDERVLPLFELSTLKAVQSIAGTNTGFKNWFQALDYMKDEITKKEFDIAIIGCGAYGFPLAAHVKRMGKKAVHMGGSTQTLFGIIGKRWETNETAKFINQHWIRPSKNETPPNALSVEDGCYW